MFALLSHRAESPPQAFRARFQWPLQGAVGGACAVKFGEPLQLFNGQDLAGWRLTDPNAVNGWSVKDGLLVNDPVQEQGQPRKNYGNLRTDQEFEDFKITLEVRVPKDGNSGVSLGVFQAERLVSIDSASGFW